MRIATLVLASVLGLALASGCGDQEEAEPEKAAAQPAEEKTPETQPTDQSAAEPAAERPKIAVSADKTHAVQPGDQITVSVTVSNFRLDPNAIGQANKPAIGHYRVYLNKTGGDDFLAEGAAPNIKITLPSDITDGSHELIVALYNNDRTPVNPPVDAGVLLIVYRL